MHETTEKECIRYGCGCTAGVFTYGQRHGYVCLNCYKELTDYCIAHNDVTIRRFLNTEKGICTNPADAVRNELVKIFGVKV